MGGETLTAHLAQMAAAQSTVELERATQAAWRAFPAPASQNRIDRAMRVRGRQLCAGSPHARLVPSLGDRRKLSLCGEVYSVGYGQNGAGERWVWSSATQWITAKLLAAGLDATVAADVVSWWSGFPHRALASIEMGGWRTDFGNLPPAPAPGAGEGVEP